MLKYTFKQILFKVPTFILIIIISFALMRMMPGDPITMLLGDKQVLTVEQKQEILHRYGFDQPIYVQLLVYIKNVFSLDLGKSFVSQRTVVSEFFELFPSTLQLALMGTIVITMSSLALGIVCAKNIGGSLDRFTQSAASLLATIPVPFKIILFIYIFSVTLKITPVSGSIASVYYYERVTYFPLIDTLFWGPKGSFLSVLSHLILPVTALSLVSIFYTSSYLRNLLVSGVNSEYAKTARAKGLPENTIFIRHILPNGLIPFAQYVLSLFGSLLTGAVVSESFFSLQGIGTWASGAVGSRDYPVLQGALVLTALMTIVINVIAEVVAVRIDPRLRKNVRS